MSALLIPGSDIFPHVYYPSIYFVGQSFTENYFEYLMYGNVHRYMKWHSYLSRLAMFAYKDSYTKKLLDKITDRNIIESVESFSPDFVIVENNEARLHMIGFDVLDILVDGLDKPASGD